MFAAVFIPDFSLQAVLRHEPQLWSQPVALIDERETKAPIFQMIAAAREAGVAEGLTSTQALARCGTVKIKARSVAQEQTTSEALHQTAYAFSPRIEATGNGICTIDLQGLPVSSAVAAGSPVEGLQQWAEKIVAALARVNLRAQIGLGHTPNVALHAARNGNPVLIVEDATAFIAALPIESLEPPPTILDILHRWGIHSVGRFLVLGKDKIAERLGPDGVELFERASPDATRPLDLLTPPEVFSEAMDFEIEIESIEPLLFILNRFIEQLSNRLTAAQFVAEELRLSLNLSSGDKYEHLFAVPSPTGNPTVLFRMLQTHLETVRTDSPIVALELSARPTRSENFQFGLFETALRDPNQFSETLARLTALCGNENVGTPVPIETHRPDAFKLERPRFEAASTFNLQPGSVSFGLRLRRFRPAFHADVQLENGEPAFISSLKLHGPVTNLSGPYRSSGDWWEQEKVWSRDEWDIQTRDGAVYRIYCERNDWFIEGVYD